MMKFPPAFINSGFTAGNCSLGTYIFTLQHTIVRLYSMFIKKYLLPHSKGIYPQRKYSFMGKRGVFSTRKSTRFFLKRGYISAQKYLKRGYLSNPGTLGDTPLET